MVKKHKKRPKGRSPKFSIYWYIVAGLIIFLLALGIFLFFHKTVLSVYIFPENPKQGDTVFIRVKSDASEITGNFGKSFGAAQDEQKLIFYRKGNSSEWVSFLGIDADQNPGDYKISVDVSATEKLTKNIKVALADFSSEPSAKAPSISQNGTTQEKAVNNIIKNDNPALKKVLSIFTKEPYFTAPFSFPLSAMKISGFSFGKFIGFFPYKLQHFGVDLRAPEKTDIYVVNDGKVIATLNLSNYGKTVIIDHGLDIFSMYLHLDEFKVSVGDIVKRGQVIGLSGDTGYVTAPHLHFSMRVGGARVDPIGFINATKQLQANFFLADISNAFLNLINNKK